METFFVDKSVRRPRKRRRRGSCVWSSRFLIMPAVDERYERLLLERFVAPAFAGTSATHLALKAWSGVLEERTGGFGRGAVLADAKPTEERGPDTEM